MTNRILVLGDSHGQTSFVNAAVDLAHKFSCHSLFQVGDFGFWTHTPEGTEFLDDVADHAWVNGVHLFFLDGNHENFDHLLKLPIDRYGWRPVRRNIHHAPRGHVWMWGDTTFMSMGGAHSIDGPGGTWKQAIGPLVREESRRVMHEDGTVEVMRLPAGTDLGNWWPEETITEEDVEQAVKAAEAHKIDVLFTHDAPISIPIHRISSYPAGDRNRELLQQVYEAVKPKYLVHGHYHRHQVYHDRKMDCLVVSLAHNEGSHGQYMFIDTDPLDVVIPDWRGQ